MSDPHRRKTLAPELVEMLGTQTHPYSPTAYIIGKGHRAAFVLWDTQLPGLDHPTCWTKNGRRVVISEPYGISYHVLGEMMQFADKHRLEFEIDARFQSWNPGSCDAVIWTKKGAPLF